jgi:translocation and assembly module TamB
MMEAEGLRGQFQNRFLDSLRVEDLRIAIGSDVWLRSAEANIQLDGEARVSKAGSEYQPIGTLQAPRGSYTLRIGPVSRDFTVTHGEVRYIGTLDAQLDIEARHTVRAVRGEEIPVIAVIEGTLYAPKLRLESTLRPPISEGDLFSYLITGYPANEATAFGGGNALELFSSALTSELERTLIQDLGVPVDLIEIRPGVGAGGAASPTQLAAGWQLGRKTFVTFNAGFCPDFSQVSTRNVGAGVEFRFSKEWRLQSAIEPTIERCGGGAAVIPLDSRSRYQIGVDVQWEREF